LRFSRKRQGESAPNFFSGFGRKYLFITTCIRKQCTRLLTRVPRVQMVWSSSPGPTKLKLRLPICKIWCEVFQLFCSLVYFILPLIDVRNFSDRK